MLVLAGNYDNDDGPAMPELTFTVHTHLMMGLRCGMMQNNILQWNSEKMLVQWGAGLEYLFNKQSSAELLHQITTVPANFKFGTCGQARTETFDLKHDFIMLSGDGHFGGGGKAEGYAGIMAGVLISNLEAPSLGKSSNNTNFAWGGRVGTNIWLC